MSKQSVRQTYLILIYYTSEMLTLNISSLCHFNTKLKRSCQKALFIFRLYIDSSSWGSDDALPASSHVQYRIIVCQNKILNIDCFPKDKHETLKISSCSVDIILLLRPQALCAWTAVFCPCWLRATREEKTVRQWSRWSLGDFHPKQTTTIQKRKKKSWNVSANVC